MQRLIICHLVLCFLLLQVSKSDAAGNCTESDAGVVWLRTPSTHYRISGLSFTAYAAAAGETLWNKFAKLSLDSLVERNRTFFTSTNIWLGNTNGECVFPEMDPSSFDFVFDPLEPYQPNVACKGSISKPCGLIWKAIRRDDMDCWIESKDDIWNGKSRRAVYVHYSYPPEPAFSATWYAQLLNESYVDSPVVDEVRGEPLKYNFIANVLKYGLKIENWPWAGPDVPVDSQGNSQSSFLSMNNNITSTNLEIFYIHYYLEFKTNQLLKSHQNKDTSLTKPLSLLEIYWSTVSLGDGDTYLGRYAENYVSYLNLSGFNGEFTAGFGFDVGYVVDNASLNFQRPFNPFNITFDFGIPELFVMSTKDFCENSLMHWENMVYDPSMTVLFVGKPEKKVSSTKIVALAVAIPIISLMIIYAVLVLAVPSSRKILIPNYSKFSKSAAAEKPGNGSNAPRSTQQQDKKDDSKEALISEKEPVAAQPSSGWSAGTKPRP